MKITHSSGQEYHLSHETKLELTRYNPFFHDMGEQSIPISLPASDHNLALLKHPESTAGRNKIDSRVDATIQSGIYSVNARQAILSAQKNGTIETSFYLREGAFYEKIKDVSLQKIFEDRKLEFGNIDAAIAFMQTLVMNQDPRFACFQVMTDTNVLNSQWHKEDNFLIQYLIQEAFYNSIERKEIIDEKEITIPKGFYITPFVKVRHILEEVCIYLGYSLGTSFLDEAPFKDMVFLNDVIDTIVKSEIQYTSIVPNISVTALFDVLRKFNIEFIPDEINKVLNVVRFNDVLDSSDKMPLDGALVGEIKPNYNNYKKVKLSSKQMNLPKEFDIPYWETGRHKIDNGNTSSEALSMDDLSKQYPTAFVRFQDGAVMRDGFKGNSSIYEIVGSLAHNYTGDGTEVVSDYSYDDTVPSIFHAFIWHYWASFTFPYVGKGKALNSSIVMSADDINEDSNVVGEDLQSNISGLEPMLCFAYRVEGYYLSQGSLSNYNLYGEKLWPYSLFYNGEDGIYEKFWRNRDNLLRNSLIEVEVDLLLSEKQKFTMSSMQKVGINGQEMVLSEMSYSPEYESVEACRFLTTKMQYPINKAKTIHDYFPIRQYRWELKYSTSWVQQSGRGQAFRFKSEPTVFYPPSPTELQFNTGGRYYESEYNVNFGTYHTTEGEFVKVSDETITVWLEAVLV